MDLQLKGKTALVTGGSQGIGRACARLLAREGVQVAVAARRTDSMETDADAIAAEGHPRPIVIAADLMTDGAPEKLAKDALAALGHIDILVNAAGGTWKRDLNAPAAEWEEGMTFNFEIHRRLTHAVIPQMIEREYGRIINISGRNEPEKHAGKINVAMSAKAALHAWAKGLSNAVAQHGITVNSLGPGKIATEQILASYTPERLEAYAREEIPAGYIGDPEDMAVVAVFLASPVARYVSGVLIPVDGSFRRYAF
jgi:3-oxoacyl-[acyl-carrier protein] reductase